MLRLISVFILWLCLQLGISQSCFAAASDTMPADQVTDNGLNLQTLNLLGEGEMSYLFWTLYRAQLFSSTASFIADDNNPKALRIEYYKHIDKQALIEATGEQWLHLGYSASAIDTWLKPLNQIWPDVTPGDALTLYVTQGGESQFYLDDKLIGMINDPAFGQAFLSIWLSKNTTEPQLRRQLLGENR
ncbi:chalcone isomerase family protein [Shewanella sp. Isolate11]|uniref:chalcone isomerase family protein n=1 Tax=Shewanella sp. Isolate11 TaxID=2908530 RepID=UPI001EFD1EA0|nr:chalcone isomerase family protein [Shewanella sp. Isolate11]MCG9697077.1 chalcone isomerase family protein [Shewanella sp. Isolate11]